MKITIRDVPPRNAWALEQAGVHPLLARLFAARGIAQAEQLDDSLALFKREVVRDLKEPSLEIRAGTAERQMPKQRQENVLDHVVGGGCAEIERGDIAPNPRTALVEQREDLVFDRNRSDRSPRNERRWERQLDHVLKFLSRHLARLGILHAAAATSDAIAAESVTVNKRRPSGTYEIEAVSVASPVEVWT